MDFIWAYILVFLLAGVPLVEAMYLAPVAILAGLSTLPVFLLSIAGNLLTVYIVIVFIDAIKRWLRKDKAESESKRTVRARKLWNKYGLAGLALLGSPIVGSHLAAFLSLAFGGTKNNVAIWMTTGIVGWTVVLSILAHFGVFFMNPENLFIERFFQNDGHEE